MQRVYARTFSPPCKNGRLCPWIINAAVNELQMARLTLRRRAKTQRAWWWELQNVGHIVFYHVYNCRLEVTDGNTYDTDDDDDHA